MDLSPHTIFLLYSVFLIVSLIIGVFAALVVVLAQKLADGRPVLKHDCNDETTPRDEHMF